MSEEIKKVEKKKNWWTKKTIASRIWFVIGVLLFIISTLLIIIFMDARRYLGNEIADVLYGEGVATGWVALGLGIVSRTSSFLITLIIIFFALVMIFVCNFITHLFDKGSRKTKTIASLFRSLIKYIVIIAAVCLILIAWGVDVAGVLAGVGVITLIVGLGCQSLIQDVVSGLFIVFDDYFTVGETVIIDGFRGTIIDVGLKTTKLQDFGGNIKSITNSSITTVVNMSRLRSVAKVVLATSYNEDVERVEAIIINEIEEIKKKVPNIIDGPWYKGIDSVGASSINYLVLCFCNESDRFQVTRDLNREFYLLFKKHNIQIPYNQVTVNPEDEKERKKASPEEIVVALKTQKELRGIKDDDKKVTPKKKGNEVIRNIKESYRKTKNDIKEL